LPNTQVGISANKAIADGNYAAILFLDETLDKTNETGKIVKDAVTAAASSEKPIRLFVVHKDDKAEEALAAKLKINKLPAFIIISDEGTFNAFSGEMKKEQVNEFLKANLK
jgi:hypothetical protein